MNFFIGKIVKDYFQIHPDVVVIFTSIYIIFEKYQFFFFSIIIRTNQEGNIFIFIAGMQLIGNNILCSSKLFKYFLKQMCTNV